MLNNFYQNSNPISHNNQSSDAFYHDMSCPEIIEYKHTKYIYLYALTFTILNTVNIYWFTLWIKKISKNPLLTQFINKSIRIIESELI